MWDDTKDVWSDVLKVLCDKGRDVDFIVSEYQDREFQ